MNKKELDQLLNIKHPLCVSIIIPTNRLATYREVDAERVNKTISLAEAELKKSYPGNGECKKVINALNQIAAEMDYTHLLDGLGIYLAPGFSQVIKFPFSVTEKIKVGDSFDARDVLYLRDNIMDYYVLSISKKYLRLYHCVGESIEELSNAHFPMVYEEQFEYAKASHANSFSSGVLVGYEKDKTFLQEERLVEFLRTADKELKKYAGKEFNLVVSGDAKEISDFMNVTELGAHVVAKVNGSYVVKEDLVRHAWKEVRNIINSKTETIVPEIAELVGKKKAVTGLDKIWEAIYEGKGLRLLIEKDYTAEVYVAMNEATISLKKPITANQYICVPDITDTLVKATLSKGGEVVFVENGSLKKYNGVALMLRYN